MWACVGWGELDGPVVTGSACLHRCSHACSVQACPANASCCASGTATCFSHLQPFITAESRVLSAVQSCIILPSHGVSEYLCFILPVPKPEVGSAMNTQGISQ